MYTIYNNIKIIAFNIDQPKIHEIKLRINTIFKTFIKIPCTNRSNVFLFPSDE